MREADALYQEAETVFRRYFAEDIRLQMDHRKANMSDVIRETTTGKYQERLTQTYREIREEEIHRVDCASDFLDQASSRA